MAKWINKAGAEIEVTDRDKALFELLSDIAFRLRSR